MSEERRKSGRNMRNLGILIAVIAITGGNYLLQQNAIKIESSEFEEYGFDFTLDIGDAYTSFSGVGSGSTPVSVSNGKYTATWTNSGMHTMYIIWLTPGPEYDHLDETELLKEGIEVVLEGTPVVFTRENEQISTTVNTHGALYEIYSFKHRGADVPGVIGVWLCDDERMFVVVTNYIEDFANPVQEEDKLMELWESCVENVSCH